MSNDIYSATTITKDEWAGNGIPEVAGNGRVTEMGKDFATLRSILQ